MTTADVKHSPKHTSSQPPETELMVSKINKKPISHQICGHHSYDSGSLISLPVKLLPWVGCGHTFHNCQPWAIKILPSYNLGNLFSGICNLVNS